MELGSRVEMIDSEKRDDTSWLSTHKPVMENRYDGARAGF